jgi:hypothetical protein
MAKTTDEKTGSGDSISSKISRLKPQCEKCFGLCRVALYFADRK